MNTQKIVTITMQDKYGQQIAIRQCSEPTEQVKEIYKAFRYKAQPFTRKKSAALLPGFKKTQAPEIIAFSSG